MTHRDLLQLATNYHKALPGRMRRYLNERGISDIIIDFHLLGWNGNRITIPVVNRQGELAFFKLATSPLVATARKEALTFVKLIWCTRHTYSMDTEEPLEFVVIKELKHGKARPQNKGALIAEAT
jgi:hypothetical protein